MLEILTKISLWDLVKHTSSWLANLKRASASRQLESTTALRKVVVAARKTAVYMRQIKETEQRSHEIETDLSVLWTELSFAMHDLGLVKLAKRCAIKGRQWADPSQFDQDFLDKADVGLDKIEQLANQLLAEIKP